MLREQVEVARCCNENDLWNGQLLTTRWVGFAAKAWSCLATRPGASWEDGRRLIARRRVARRPEGYSKRCASGCAWRCFVFVRWTWSDEGTLVQQQQPPSGTRCCGCDADDHARWEQCKRWAADGREVALRAGQQRTWRGGSGSGAGGVLRRPARRLSGRPVLTTWGEVGNTGRCLRGGEIAAGWALRLLWLKTRRREGEHGQTRDVLGEKWRE